MTPETKLYLVSNGDNDLVRVLQERVPFHQVGSLAEAVDRAPEGAGILVLADHYPDAPTEVDPTALARAGVKSQRVYIEYPAELPGIAIGEVVQATWERAVVASDVFGDLERGRILMIHACHALKVEAANPHIVLARIAGFDRAIYDLPVETTPILCEHAEQPILFAATKLSQFQTARYAPSEAWPKIWSWIIGWVTRTDPKDIALTWSPTVHPTFTRDEILSSAVEQTAIKRGVQWFQNAKLMVDPSWEEEASRRLAEFPNGTVGPNAEWPAGDGSCGMIEGAGAKVNPDGSQDWRYYLRNDCMGEVAMALAFGENIHGDPQGATIARNLNDYIHFNSPNSRRSQGDPAHPAYGLVTWNNVEGEGVYYGDDNARSLMGTMATAGLLKEDRWDESILRCLLANLRTTGPQGFRNSRLSDSMLSEKGWRYYWNTERVNCAPHYESWLWACYLWAYHHTGYEPFKQRAYAGIYRTMEAYSEGWIWTNGMQQERARMLMPLAWLVRVDDTAQHRGWLRRMADELLQFQDTTGAIREELGPPGKGQYAPPKTNEEYGTTEAPLIQENGDPLCDLLDTTNFAFAGLREAYAATGESFYLEAEDRLAAFLCRVQVRSEVRPEFDGAWFRAFEFQRWEYWASNADLGWGAWSIESGWTQGWIVSTLAMRQLKTSLWDLSSRTEIARHCEALVAQMFPDV